MKTTIAKAVRFIFITLIISGCSIFQPTEEFSPDYIADQYVEVYNSGEFNYSLFPYSKIDSIKFDLQRNSVTINFDKKFAGMPFRNENVDSIYNETRNFFNQYLIDPEIKILSMNKEISELIPNYYRKSKSDYDNSRIPPKLERELPVSFNLSKNFKPTQGLFNRNVALWHSHGWYYNHRLDRWLWQRARLFQTVEDLGPFSFTIPFIVPMLENAGANVFLPRERDTQLNELIIDNRDASCVFSGEWEKDSTKGFFMEGNSIEANINPFDLGDYSYSANSSSSVQYIPDIPERGEYSVSISYQSNEKSSENVIYTVYHSGGKTEFEINQSIGGGTWIYLGKFNFEKGKNPDIGKVVITSPNLISGEIFTTDAVRFGGGYGIVERNGKTSGRPKFTEGARYYMQFLGMPDSLVYNINGNENDYKDDYQGRGEWVNYLKGNPSGPNKNREVKGLGIPIDASVAFHTDAGITNSDTTIGTLLIYTIDGMDSTSQFPDGYSRFANRDFVDIMQSEIVNDIRYKYDPVWNRRDLREAQYSESTRPNVPAALLELASHQNFLDARFMADPRFRFDVSRSIYKSILKFLSVQYNFEYIVQPLPVNNFSIERTGKNSIKLSWNAVEDPLERTAVPQEYRIYTSLDSSGFDNGTVVKNNFYEINNLEYDKIYNFKVTAVNNGGESFPSEVLSCSFVNNDNPTVLIVNGFDRISPPAHIITNKFSGFFNSIDQGVPYYYDYGFTGDQHNFYAESQWGTDDLPGHGASYSDFETRIIAGNTFDYSYTHGKAIKDNGYSFISCSDESVELGKIKLTDYQIVDIIMGEEKTTNWTKAYSDSLLGRQFTIFTPGLVSQLNEYFNNGGKLFISGSYLGTDVFLNEKPDSTIQSFVKDKLKYRLASDHAVKNGGIVSASDKFNLALNKISFITEMNENFYNAEAPDALTPIKGSGTLLRYSENLFSAAIGFKGDYSLAAFGFPFETIISESARKKVMAEILNFLTMDEK